jgi:hypothetical protein
MIAPHTAAAITTAAGGAHGTGDCVDIHPGGGGYSVAAPAVGIVGHVGHDACSGAADGGPAGFAGAGGAATGSYYDFNPGSAGMVLITFDK